MMPHTLVLEFSPDERRVIQAAYAHYLNVVKVIADLHALEGRLAVSPDGRGLLRADAATSLQLVPPAAPG